MVKDLLQFCFVVMGLIVVILLHFIVRFQDSSIVRFVRIDPTVIQSQLNFYFTCQDSLVVRFLLNDYAVSGSNPPQLNFC